MEARQKLWIAVATCLLIAVWMIWPPRLNSAAACEANARVANLAFPLQDINGNAVSLSEYRGTVILLDFWATWCAACKIEFPGSSSSTTSTSRKG